MAESDGQVDHILTPGNTQFRRHRAGRALALIAVLAALSFAAAACGGGGAGPAGVTIEPIHSSATSTLLQRARLDVTHTPSIPLTADADTSQLPRATDTVTTDEGDAGTAVQIEPIPEEPPATPQPPRVPASLLPPGSSLSGSITGLRIYSNGDSTSYFMSLGVLALAAAQGAIQVQPAADYQISSGLLGGASFDWYGYLASEMATYAPDVVVFMVGANDAHVGMDLAAYATRVGQMMDQLSATRLIWVGQPNMGRPDLAASIPGINQVFAAEAAKRPWVRYVDTWSLTSDTTGAFTPYLPDGSLARGADGVHFTSAGGLYLAQAVIAAIIGG